MTHGTFAVLDNERNLPTVPGRRNRDYSIWDFKDGGRFYTVFPYFHLAGFLSLLGKSVLIAGLSGLEANIELVNPIFTESSSPVLGPPLMPPSGMLLKEVMKHQKLRALYLPPSIAEQLLLEPHGLEFFKGLDFLCYTGGPFSPEAGKRLSTVTELCPLYGSTEAFQVPQLAPAHKDDWAWMEWNPHFKVDMQPCSDEVGTYELVLFADATTEDISALNHNLPGVKEYRTKDLFRRHPEKPMLWQYYGRRDDIIVLSNGSKFNPVPMELTIQSHPLLTGALVVGMGKPQAALLLESKEQEGIDSIVTQIWPVIERANQLAPSHGHIMRNMIITARLDKPFVRAGKGTVVRKLTEECYQSEIEELYASTDTLKGLNSPRKLDANSDISTILDFTRGAVAHAFPEMSHIGDDDNMFSHGLDSLKSSHLVRYLQNTINLTNSNSDPACISTRVIYRNPTIRGLANVLQILQSTGELCKGEARETKMERLLNKYTTALPRPSNRQETPATTKSVALLGSTGYLGPYILASLLKTSDISAIYCLNRGDDAHQRTCSALERICGASTKEFSTLAFLKADLDKPRLGLTELQYDDLLEDVDTIIFNSWNPNFSLPLESFEHPFLRGMRTAIEWSLSSNKRPRILFISSIAAIGNWPKAHPEQPNIPEEPALEHSVPMVMGYGESKCIAEQMLSHASQTSGLSASIFRAGQIGGPSDPAMGPWPIQGWLYSLLKSGRKMNALPKAISPLDWIPVDTFASAIAKDAQNRNPDNGVQTFNLVHPDPAAWDLFLSALKKAFSFQAVEVSLPEWLDRLSGITSGSHEKRSGTRVSGIYEFLRSLGEGREEDMQCHTKNAATLLQDVVPLKEDLLMAWLRTWNPKSDGIKGRM
jgi:thioester reductase-like protein